MVADNGELAVVTVAPGAIVVADRMTDLAARGPAFVGTVTMAVAMPSVAKLKTRPLAFCGRG